MVSKSIFKTYDIRGVYPKEINDAAVAEIASALVSYFKKGVIIVGHDARLSSPILYKAAIRVLKNESGIMNQESGKKISNKPQKFRIIPVGLITTPMLYFLVNKIKAAGGIMITASHNPKEYNGMKVVGKGGEVMSGKEIYRLIKKIETRK